MKAPIFTVKGMTAALIEDHGAALGEGGREMLNYVIEATKRLEQLVASVIEYSAVATKDIQEGRADLNQAIAGARADLTETR